MEWNGALGYAAGLVSGSAGTALLNHWLTGRRDERKAERDRLAEERASERQRKDNARPRQLARIDTVRAAAHELRALARDPNISVHQTADGSFSFLPSERDHLVTTTIQELSDDDVAMRWFDLNCVTFQMLLNSRAGDETAALVTHIQLDRSYATLVSSLNELERQV